MQILHDWSTEEIKFLQSLATKMSNEILGAVTDKFVNANLPFNAEAVSVHITIVVDALAFIYQLCTTIMEKRFAAPGKEIEFQKECLGEFLEVIRIVNPKIIDPTIN